MTREQVLRRLCELAAEQASVDVSQVAPDTDLLADLNFDSLDFVEYTMLIEEEFEVSVADDQAQDVRTPAQALSMLWPLLS
jgi:acyl carrier protein